MARSVTNTPKKAQIKASKKPKIEEMSQTHGALTPDVDMAKMFNIKTPYNVNSIEEYRKQIRAFNTPDLHAHAHHVGLVPLDPRDKLYTALERKFNEVKSRALPTRLVATKINPEFAEFHRQFMQGVTS